MKIRTGFVSNSSSSSFMMVVPESIWDDLIAKATPYEKHVVEQLFRDGKFDGKRVKLFNDEVGNEREGWIMYIDEHESEAENKDWTLYEKRSNAFYDFVNRAREEYPGVVLIDDYC